MILLGAAAAAATALLLAMICAAVLWIRRRRQVLRGLRNYGRVEFADEDLGWSPDGHFNRALPFFEFVVVPLLIGMLGSAAVIGLLWGQGMFELVLSEIDDDIESPVSWIASLAVSYGISCGGGYLLFRRLRQRGQAYLTGRSAGMWKKAGQEAKSRMAELDRLVQEIGQTSRSLDLELVLDVTAGANGLFREVSEHYPTHTDAAVVRATFALCEKRLLLFKEELAEDVALFWEAVAAISEAEIASGSAETQEAEVLARLGDLKERLLSMRLPAHIKQKQWWTRDQGTTQDYRKIVSAITTEAEGLAGDLRVGAKIEGTVGAPHPDKMGEEEEAYALLGADPIADREEIGRLCVRLLDVWAGPDGEAATRRREIQTARATLQQNMTDEHG